MSALLLVALVVAVGCLLGVVVSRGVAARRRRLQEPLSDVADRVLAQLRALPETRERKTYGRG
jgi:hypothetical protein